MSVYEIASQVLRMRFHWIIHRCIIYESVYVQYCLLVKKKSLMLTLAAFI